MSQVQFISYCVNLGYKMVNGKNTYPSLDKDLDDMNERIAHLDAVINKVKADAKVSKDKRVTKIFMIPEFFFRGKKGYYPVDNIQILKEVTNKTYPEYLVKMLQSSFLNNQLEDWILICGTAVYGWKRGTDTYVYNCSLVQEGNYTDPAKAHEVAHLIQKEFKSEIDFVELGNNPYIHLEPMPSSSLATELQKRGYDGSSIFKLRSIPVKVGLEICLDHFQGRLQKATATSEGKDIKIQLIPSAGMTIKKDQIVVVSGGYVFNCDGLISNIFDPKTGNTKEDPYRLKTDFAFHSQLLKKSSSSYEDILPQQRIEVEFKGAFAKAKDLFNGQSGQVYIYQPQAL